MNRTFLSALILSVFLVLGIAATAFGDANWVSLNGSSTPQKPTVAVLSSTETETVIRVTAHGFWATEIAEDGQIFQALNFPGYGTALEIGKPAVPVISERVGIPGSANVSVSVVDAVEVTLPGYNVHPFQTPLRESEQRVTFDIDRGLYSQNAFYPEVQAQVSQPRLWRDLRIVVLQFNPITFNPVTGELKACTEMTVKLAYTGTSDVNVQQFRRPVPANYDAMYRKSVLNYDYLEMTLESEAEQIDAAYDMLIIAADAYLSNVAPLAAHKNAMGLATTVVPISAVGTNYTAIKNYIQNEYNTNGISYVLLVGNESDIPAYTGYGFFSDYYYSLLAGSDDDADIAIGRFSVGNSAHVDNMVNKTITFEGSPPPGDWLEKSLLVANWELAPAKYQECKEQIRTAAEIPGNYYSVLYPDFTTAYGASYANGGDEATNADVIAYIDAGQRLVNYRGHGSETTWQYWNTSGEYFRISDVDAIDNGDLTPVVFSIACLNNNLSYSQTTIGEAFTRGDDAAVAYLGASDPSYTTPNHDYDKQLYSAIFHEGINAVGDASNIASVRVIDLWGTYGITNARMYLWLGDPSLGLIYEGEPRPGPPVLVSPDDGAYFDAPAVVDLDWEDEPLSQYYHVQVDNNADFSSPEAENTNVTPSQWQTPSLAEDIYFWRVRGGDDIGYGSWSVVRSIFVGIQVQAPVLYSPADAAKIKNDVNIPLEWYRIEGVAGYNIEIDNNPDFSSPEQTGYSAVCTNGTCLYYINPALMPGEYYWRVKADETGWPWSDVWSFRLQGRVKKDAAEDGLPQSAELYANRPNPFNPKTAIRFALAEPGHVRLTVYNIMGQKVA
ncbi:MAG: hypothetical protein JSW34_09635, partial [Candidatus Zixiibacteriota bacterium]